jgi:hypothetical protein
MGTSGRRHAPTALYPREKEPPVPTVQEAGWAPELFWMQRLEEKSSASVGDRTPVVQSVVRHYTDWATPAPSYLLGLEKKVVRIGSERNCLRIIFSGDAVVNLCQFYYQKCS